MNQFYYAGLFIKNAKKLAFLAFLFGGIFSILELADAVRASQAKTYTPSRDMDQMRDLYETYKETSKITSTLVKELNGQALALPLPKLYETYATLEELLELEAELDLIDEKVKLLKNSVIKNMNINLDSLIGELDKVIKKYEAEGLIETQAEVRGRNASLFSSSAVDHLPETLKGLSEARVFIDELAAQMNKKTNKSVAEDYLKKLNVLSQLIQRDMRGLDMEETIKSSGDGEARVLQVRTDLVRIKENLASALSASWKIEEELAESRKIFNREYSKCEIMSKELRSLRISYAKNILLLLISCVTLPFIILVLADYLKAVIDKEKPRSGNRTS